MRVSHMYLLNKEGKYFVSCMISQNHDYICREPGMLRSEDMRKKDSAVKCLEVMATSDPDHWRAILEAGRGNR